MIMDDREAIRELYREYWRYMIDKDVRNLKRLMADDYVLMHMTGVQQSRETFLSGLKDGTFNYYSAEHESIEVTVNGDTARMIGKSRVTAAVYGGRISSWKLRGDFTLRKENGAWLMTGSKASAY